MVYFTLIILLAAVDLVLKWVIDRQDPETFPRILPHSGQRIMLHRHHNAGFPFGFLQKYGAVVRTVPLVVISGLSGALCSLMNQKGKTLRKISLAVIIGGALSNLYDRLVKKYVVDYFSFQFGPLKRVIFNLGDLFVFLGSGIWMGLEILTEVHAKMEEKRTENAIDRS